MNLIWRFYIDERQQWRWQRLSMSKEVVADSPAGHADYDACVADAKREGYDYQNSQPGKIRVRPTYR